MVTNISIIGKKFGRLTALREVKHHVYPSGQVGRKFAFRCDCGKETVVFLNLARRGKSLSCGCLRLERLLSACTKHGMGTKYSCHPLYRTWKSMRQRCNNPSNPAYINYGGRGIRVCKRWEKFENFRDDMLPRWEKGLTLDRINNDGNYSPRNCRWATRLIQNNNRRDNIKYKGKSITEWSRLLGGSHRLVAKRLRSGWSWERATTTPVKS